MQKRLNDGSLMIYSAEDDDLANKWTWGSRGGYAVGNYTVSRHPLIQKKRTFHRIVMARALGRELMPGEDIDHANRNKMDNRRENLRVATRGQNMANRSYINRTGYRGVHQPPSSFIAGIKVEHTRIYIGSFPTAEEAAWMYDQYAISLHGEFASLNFEYA